LWLISKYFQQKEEESA